jgi:hypothetical protein
MVAVGDIVKWGNEIKAEYGVDINYGLFLALKDTSDIIQDEKYFIWCIEAKDQFGERYLSVLAWGIKRGCRSVGVFREVQKKIISLAKNKKVGYIIQGSHLNGKLHKVLARMGYKVAAMRRDI